MANENSIKLVQDFLVDKERKILEFDEGDRTTIIVKIPYAEGYEKLCIDSCYNSLEKADNQGKYDLHNSIDYAGILDMNTGEVFECKYNFCDYVNHKEHDSLRYNLAEKVIQKFRELYSIGALTKMIQGEITDRDEEDIKYWTGDRANNLYVQNVKPEEYLLPIADAYNYYTLVDILNSRDENKMNNIVNRIVVERIKDKNVELKQIVLYENIKARLTELWKNGDKYLDILRAFKHGITSDMNTVKLKIKIKENESIVTTMDTQGLKRLSPLYKNDTISTWYIPSLKERNAVEQYMKDIKLEDVLAISYRGKNIYERKEVA